MRIDLPQCNLKTCRYSSDGNCVDPDRYHTCEHTFLKAELQRNEMEHPKSNCDGCMYQDKNYRAADETAYCSKRLIYPLGRLKDECQWKKVK